MANPDRPSGFKFVKTLSGAPMSAVMRSIGVTNAADIFRGDLISLASNLAAVAATNDATFLGVAVGFGKITQMTAEFGPAINPDNLTTIYYDDSASTDTDFRCFYVPVDDAIFEVQGDSVIASGAIGDPVDLVATAGNTTTGISAHEVGANTNTDMRIVEIPAYPDNDPALANARYWVTITKAEMYFQ